MFKNTAVALSAIGITSLLFSGTTFAATNRQAHAHKPIERLSKQVVNKFSEKKIDNILARAGMPSTKINSTPLFIKKAIIEGSGLHFKFVSQIKSNYHRNQDGTLTKITTPKAGQISPNAISTSDLALTETVTQAGSGQYLVSESFQWNVIHSVTGDHIGIAVPEGWDLVANSYWDNEWEAVGGVWRDYGQQFSGGRPDQIDIYGADWSFTDAQSKDFPSWKVKGVVQFDMTQANPTAQRRVVGRYCEAPASTGSISVSVLFDSASISYSSSSSIQTAGVDASF